MTEGQHIPREWDRRDPYFVKWLHAELNGTQCLFCTHSSTDWCHVQHGSHRSSDFLGFPACNECHMRIDHKPRWTDQPPQPSFPMPLRQGYVDERKAIWFAFGLPALLAKYAEYREAVEVR